MAIFSVDTQRVERCIQCDEPTGHAGIFEDSLFNDRGEGPFCDECFEHEQEKEKRADQ